MSLVLLPVLALLVSVAGTVSATHVSDCVVASEDPASHLTFDLTGAGGGIHYDEERGNPFGVPVPLSSFLLGPDDPEWPPAVFDGAEESWFYEEANGHEDLQRGGSSAVLGGGWWPPDCGLEWQLTDGTAPCPFLDRETISDETCRHGPDRLVARAWF